MTMLPNHRCHHSKRRNRGRALRKLAVDGERAVALAKSSAKADDVAPIQVDVRVSRHRLHLLIDQKTR